MAPLRRRLALVCAALLWLPGCVQDDGDRWTPLEYFSEVDLDEERALGMDFDRQLQQVVPVIHDPVVAGFLNDLGQSIVRGIEPQPFLYRFRVIDDRSLNAFAVPGGYIYFHSATILEAGSLDELAGVMGHEIAHVKGRHFARMQKQSQLPDLLANLAGIAVAVAARDAAPLITAQAANVALKLRFSREFEAEADDRGAVFMTRAGFEPRGLERFFERILAEHERNPTSVPPYLFSHPEVEDRIEAVRDAGASLRPLREPDPGLEQGFRDARERLGLLVHSNRTALPVAKTSDPGANDAALAEAARLAEDRPDEALALLTRTALRDDADPRVHYQIGELLFEQGRYHGAARAYARTAALDPGRARVHYRLGLAHKALGDHPRAVYHLEQAIHRAGERSRIREQAEWEVVKLTFGVVSEGGFADGRRGRGADTPAGASRASFRLDDPALAWWGRVSPRFVPHRSRIRVRWVDPRGAVRQDAAPEEVSRVYLVSVLALEAEDARVAGDWTVETLLDDDVVDRRRVHVSP